jgi:2,4-dienoyl-CoA reductase-like NADH-dependent reductase (Old Yellow Enzyme family)/pyruvate/2-oxoglutarate dehydrogenase complex dihydrolipoamide dehydrogenase (E3) component
MEPYAKLFSPFSLGGLKLKNRIVMAAMGNNLSHPQGNVSDQSIAYYQERAKGGVGLIITEACPVSLPGRHRGQSLCVYEEAFLPDLERLTKAIHEHGAAIALQIHHAGRLSDPKIIRSTPLAPSPIPRAPGLEPPKELSLDEIQAIIEQFGIAARRAKSAGFDAVEIHGAHGYLIHQFRSARSNQRQDLYGGTPQNRGRFALEVLQRVRREVGDSFPIIFRMSAQELVPGGFLLEESLDLALELEKAGVAALHVSGGTTDSVLDTTYAIPPMEYPDATHVPQVAKVRKKVGLPLIAVGRLGNPSLAEGVLRDGYADLIALGRPLLTDPYWPAKVAKGEIDRIRPCVACNYCIWRLMLQEKITCFQNAQVAHEEEYQIRPAEKPRKVLVIGGGPAGLEASRVAKMRGHQVTLLEKTGALGGQLRLASIPPYKQKLEEALKWMIAEVKREGVEIKFNTEWDALKVEKEKPDAVIVATGAVPVMPGIFHASRAVTAWEVLDGKETGKKVLILGGGTVGVETAEFLNGKGCQVTVVEMMETLAADMEVTTRELLLKRIEDKGISILLSTKVLEAGDGQVLVSCRGEEKRLTTETVVLALGSRSARGVVQALEENGVRFSAVGDCLKARKAREAIHEGFVAALEI